MRKIWYWIKIAITIVSALIFFLAIGAIFSNPQIFILPPIIALGFPILVIWNFILIIYWLKYQWRIALLPFILLILSIPAIDRTFKLQFEVTHQEKDAIKIMTYNMHGMTDFAKLTKDEKSKMTDAWHKTIRSFDGVHILCIQEFSNSVRQFLLDHFPHEYGASCSGKGYVRILSTFPVIDKGCIHFDNLSYYRTIWADIKLPNDTIRVYNTQLESNKISGYEKELVQLNEHGSSFIFGKLSLMLSTYKKFAPIRVTQLKKIMSHIETSPYPVILAGDINEIPQSYLYRLITKRFEDAFQSLGSGFDVTYAGNIPFLRIDYIFTDPEFQHIDYNVGELKLSDHYPILLSTRLSKK